MKTNMLSILLIVGTALVWAFFYSQLPAQIPMQWGVNGEVNWTAPKLYGMFMNMGMLVVLYLVLRYSPKLDPKKQNYKRFSKSYGKIAFIILLTMVFVNFFTVLTSAGYDLPINRIIPVLIGLLFIGTGNYMQQVKPNYFIGIRTPWTLKNDDVWRKTHRFGSKTFILAGVLFTASVFLSAEAAAYYILPAVLLLLLLPVAYSYLSYRKIN